ncbi:unnamed protein product [Adineta ricciae]|uniref:BZIP domain-containing protein n=1 Tax=Adineta ricciae TaxID=249248 RepID=A0A813VW33_ADIRI|nr:unnamed protein product [Adineta ricciae]
MHRRPVSRNDPRYKQLRVQNNKSVQRSREKSRRERELTLASIAQLEKDNEEIIQRLAVVKEEYEQLQSLFKQHTGIDIEQMIDSEPKSTTKSSSVPLQSKENSPNTLLTINTTEKQQSAKAELDANNLDGSIVLINGVQYKIVSLNKT